MAIYFRNLSQFNPFLKNIVLDSTINLNLCKNSRVNLLISEEDLYILMEDLENQDIHYLSARTSTRFLPILIGISRIKKVNLLIYSDQEDYWKYWVSKSHLYQNLS